MVTACMLLLLCASSAHGQAEPTAIRKRALTFFGLGNGTNTDLSGYLQGQSYRYGGKNLAITAGADLGVWSFSRYVLSAEVRGTFPAKNGRVVGEKSILGGARISREPIGSLGVGGRFRPYADVLFGRGAMDYQSGGYPYNGFIYYRTNSWVYGGGVGAEYDVFGPFSAKAEVQFQHWSTPVLPTGSAVAIQGGVGIAYRFGAGKGPR